MGNDILGDDGVALLVARQLRSEFSSPPPPSPLRGEGVSFDTGQWGGEGAPNPFSSVDIVESAEAGLAIMELLAGSERALILDCIATGKHAPGTLLEFTVDDFRKVVAPSPHYAGLPEVIEMAARLGIDFPKHLRVLAMEVENPWTVQESMSPSVSSAIPALVSRTRSILKELLES